MATCQPTESRLYLENNVIENNSGICSSENTYGDEEFQCPAIHIFRASATIYNNVVKSNLGDALRIKGGIVNVQNNDMQTESFAVNISHRMILTMAINLAQSDTSPVTHLPVHYKYTTSQNQW